MQISDRLPKSTDATSTASLDLYRPVPRVHTYCSLKPQADTLSQHPSTPTSLNTLLLSLLLFVRTSRIIITTIAIIIVIHIYICIHTHISKHV